MIIGQITDLHIGFDGQDKPCANMQRLHHVLDSLRSFRRGPDVLLLTGDLVESGEQWAYEKLKDALTSLHIPAFFALGNHDNRETFAEVFGDANFNDGFLQYVIEDYPVRIIVLDSLKPGRHGGSFCEQRADWLRARLSEQPDRPTLIALHHPPIVTHIGWMTAKPGANWTRRLSDVVSDFPNVIQIISGHIHRTITQPFGGSLVSVANSVAPQVKLEFADIDADVPDGRILLTEDLPGYCLHYWDGNTLTSHTGTSPEGRIIARFDEKHSSVVHLTTDAGGQNPKIMGGR